MLNFAESLTLCNLSLHPASLSLSMYLSCVSVHVADQKLDFPYTQQKDNGKMVI